MRRYLNGRISIVKLVSMVFLVVMMSGCRDISNISVTLDDPITESGEYECEAAITLSNGHVMEENVRVNVTIREEEAELVVVTKTGVKYHPLDSRYAQNEGARIIPKEQAEAEGYLPSEDYLLADEDE